MIKVPNKSIILAILVLGANSIIAQIILTRELLVAFYGNEISIGLILAIWLLAGGLGAWIFGRVSDRINSKLIVFIACELFLSVCAFSSLLLIRAIKPFFNILPGELTSLPIMIFSSILTLAPVCLLIGFLFTLGCRIVKVYKNESVAQVGYVYALEAIGAASGGLLCSLFLIKFVSAFNLMFFLVAFNLLFTLWFLRYTELASRSRKIFEISIAVILFLFLFLKVSSALDAFDTWTKEAEWKGFNLLENRNSIYGNISVTKQGNLYSFFNNGILMFTVPDLLTQEESIHFAALQRPDAKTVLLIGGGSSGSLWEILKYPVESVDYIELDPVLIELAKKHLRSSDLFMLDDFRVNTITADGRAFLWATKKSYDIIILSLPDPFTAQLNRFYTKEFFTTVKEKLVHDGVFCFGLTSSENYLSKELEMFLSSIYATLKEVFGDIQIIPGDTAYFLASAKPGLLTLDHKELTRRLEEENIQTKFVREYYLFSKLSDRRLSYISNRLKHAHPVNINRDFSPVSYYYDMILWGTYFTGSIKSIFKYVNKKVIYAATAILCFVIMLSGAVGRKEARPKRAVLIAMATTGFSEIGFELIIIIAFQVLYGYLYYKLGLIVTSFMIGLSMGGFLCTKKLDSIREPYKEFIKVQTAICLYPLLLPVIFHILHTTESQHLKIFGSNIIFTLLPIVAGFMGGLQFPLANRIYLENTRSLGHVAGLSYGADMAGSCLGALVVSVFIIPIIGINAACILIVLLNLSSLFILLHNKKS